MQWHDLHSANHWCTVWRWHLTDGKSGYYRLFKMVLHLTHVMQEEYTQLKS